MNTPFYITRRIAFSNKGFSGFVIKIAVLAVALSVAVMIISTSIIAGFQNQIKQKIYGFWGNIHLKAVDFNQSYEDIKPISLDSTHNFLTPIRQLPQVQHIQSFAHKAGIIKTDTDIEGILLKGIANDFDWSFFKQYLVSGNTFALPDSAAAPYILISETTAKRLLIQPQSELIVYFVQNPPRIRKFTVAGIYKTGLEEYDEKYALIDMRHIQKLNKWDSTQVGGFQIYLKQPEQNNEITEQIHLLVPDSIRAINIKEINPNIFEWINLQNMNERVITTLMTLVAIINMITTLLILILERTNTIGILKALGATNWFIQKIFLYNAALIVALGLLVGNLFALIICFIQQKFQIITLPEKLYYLHIVPIQINPLTILLINIATIATCLLILIIPSYLVTRIQPIKAITFK